MIEIIQSIFYIVFLYQACFQPPCYDIKMIQFQCFLIFIFDDEIEIKDIILYNNNQLKILLHGIEKFAN